MAYQLQHDLHFAQIQALKNNQKVILCPTINLKQCSTSWRPTYLIGLWHTDNTVTPLKIRQSKSKINLSFHALNQQAIVFDELGYSQNQGSILLQYQETLWRLVLLHSGRVRIEKTTSPQMLS